MISKVTKYNHKNGFYDYAYLSDKKFDKKDIKKISEEVVDSIENIIAETKINLDLSAYGYKNADEDKLLSFCQKAKLAFDFNPVSFSQNDIIMLMK